MVHQISEDLRHPGTRFRHLRKPVTAGCTIFNVNGPLIKKKNPGVVRNLKFATYLKFATCGITNKLNELR